MITPEQERAFYDRQYDAFLSLPDHALRIDRAVLEKNLDDPAHPFFERRRLYRAAIAALLEDPLPGRRVLDYGCGPADFGVWPTYMGLWLLFLCSFSTSAGSTGGGIKMMRAVLLYKQVHRELRKLIHPNAQIPLRLGDEIVPNKIVYSVLAFIFIYVASIVSLSFVLSFTGLDVLTAFSAVVACINNTGPGLGQVGPATTYAVLSDFQVSVCAFAMLLGRLELFTLLVVLTPAFWRR